jgi:D-alanine-D-alanine ligase
MSRYILVLYNLPVLDPSHPDAESERESVDTAEQIAKALEAAGHRITSLGLGVDPRPLLDLIERDRPDAVFNLFEGLATQSGTEPVVAGLLEWLGVPFTGSPSPTLQLCRDKPRAKLLMQGAGIPTPRFMAMTPQGESSSPGDWAGPWPVIVKPGAEDASVGLDQTSVVTTQAQLMTRVQFLLDRYGPPVLVEQFIDGREFNLSLIADPTPRVLPLAEIVFERSATDLWPIVTYDAKWSPESRDYLATPPVCPAQVADELAERLRAIALQAFEVFGCRQYARFDFRVDPAGQPFLLEVNPNPDINPTAGLTQALLVAGLTHGEFVIALVEDCLGLQRR